MSPSSSVIFADLDGTLLNSDLTISSRNRRALRTAMDRGTRIVLASGRPTASVAKFVIDDAREQFLISSNGGCTVSFPSRKVIAMTPMPPGVVEIVTSIARSHCVAYCLYSPTAWFVATLDRLTEIEISRSGTSPRRLRDLAELDDPIVKVLLIGGPRELQACEEDFAHIRPQPINCFRTYPEYLEVMPAGSSKSAACISLLGRLGMLPTQAIAFGNGEGDISMLDCVGTSVVVANACEAAVEHAHYVCPANDDDGVAVAIEGLLFGDRDALALLRRGGRADA